MRLPRTWTSAAKDRSMRARCSSPGQSRLTMLMLLGTTTACLVVWGATARPPPCWMSVMDAPHGAAFRSVMNHSMLRDAYRGDMGPDSELDDVWDDEPDDDSPPYWY